MDNSKLPKFSDLPLNSGDPPFSAWGLYGTDDELGALNRLTDEVVLEAAKEIKSGTRISLNWPLDAQKDLPLFGRHTFAHDIIHKAPRTVNDDTWFFNTQSSSQWDGLRHFGYQKQQKFYNGVTLEQIHGENKSNILGVGAWSKHGIVGRGVLLDYYTWSQKHSIPHEPFKTHPIKLEHLKAVAKEQGTEFKFGDILIVRSGYMVAYNALSRGDIEELRKRQTPHFAGVEQSEEVLEWIWNNFSAISGDQPAFECWPTQKEYAMHEVFLAGWGMPIGELFDLEALAEQCSKVKRWSFFVTSEVVNVPAGVASPPNILAIF